MSEQLRQRLQGEMLRLQGAEDLRARFEQQQREIDGLKQLLAQLFEGLQRLYQVHSAPVEIIRDEKGKAMGARRVLH